MKNLAHGRFIEQMATNAEVNAVITEIEEMIDKYGWQDKVLRPYGYADKLVDLIKSWKMYADMTLCSKQVIVAEINGALPLIEAWEEYEKEEKVTIRVQKTGSLRTVAKSLAFDLVDLGGYEIVSA